MMSMISPLQPALLAERKKERESVINIIAHTLPPPEDDISKPPRFLSLALTPSLPCPSTSRHMSESVSGAVVLLLVRVSSHESVVRRANCSYTNPKTAHVVNAQIQIETTPL